jgi:hypothetical protein
MSTGDPLELFTIPELAAMWKTGKDWLEKGVQARRWEFTRAGREIRFTRAQAAAILASRAVEPAHIPTRDEVAAKRGEVTRSDRSAA